MTRFGDSFLIFFFLSFHHNEESSLTFIVYFPLWTLYRHITLRARCWQIEHLHKGILTLRTAHSNFSSFISITEVSRLKVELHLEKCFHLLVFTLTFIFLCWIKTLSFLDSQNYFLFLERKNWRQWRVVLALLKCVHIYIADIKLNINAPFWKSKVKNWAVLCSFCICIKSLSSTSYLGHEILVS